VKVGIPKEILGGEKRVALIPESVNRLLKKGFEVSVESGAGEDSFFSDKDYQEAGAQIESSVDSLYAGADVVVKINTPGQNEKVGKHEIDMMKEGAILVSFLFPLTNSDIVERLARRKISSFSVDMIPRTTLAQSMDVLSSMSTVAGYKAVLTSAMLIGKFFPMFMTAAGTIPPVKMLILGAGVAGLQAIATARKLGAVVEVFDTRKVVKEQVQSLGAKFIEVESTEDAQSATGYAKELSDEYKRKQEELIHKHIAKSDICITTALIPGKRAPVLITEEMVKGMKTGSVIVDLAAEQGGNCALTEPGKQVLKHGVMISGILNIPSTMPIHASQMFSKNLEKYINHLTDDKKFKMDFSDEITSGSLITHNGEIVNSRVKEAVGTKGGGG
jgi:H+-translocating NAD(P) transhydrogenase subunit alpha